MYLNGRVLEDDHAKESAFTIVKYAIRENF